MGSVHPLRPLVAADWAAAPPLPLDPRPGTAHLDRTALGALGIELLHCDTDCVIARMPLAGDRSAAASLLVLAETVASTAAGLAAGPAHRAFGAELNASLLVEAPAGVAVARATPLALGIEQHVWQLEAIDAAGNPLLAGRCTLGIVAATATPRPAGASAPAH